MQNQIFNGLIKDCFRAMEYREEFFLQERKKQVDYTFGTIICYIEDVKFLGNRTSAEVTLNDKIKELEDNQHKHIADQLSGTPMTEIQMNTDDGIADYLESNFRMNSRPDSYERTPSTHQFSSYLSSFLNNPLEIHKEIVHQSSIGNRPKKIFNSNLNTFENFKEEHAPNFQSKDQFYKQYSIEKQKKSLYNGQQKENMTLLNGKLLSDFNDELWQITTQQSEDITYDTNRNNIKSINSNYIKELSLYDKKNRLINYQKQDEEELIQKRYQNKFDNNSTAFEVHSAYSAYPTNKLSRKNSFKEFAKISNEFNLLTTSIKNNNISNQKSLTSLLPLPEDLLSANTEK